MAATEPHKGTIDDPYETIRMSSVIHTLYKGNSSTSVAFFIFPKAGNLRTLFDRLNSNDYYMIFTCTNLHANSFALTVNNNSSSWTLSGSALMPSSSAFGSPAILDGVAVGSRVW